MKETFVCSAVIINDRNESLLIRRAREPEKDKWSNISGIGASMKGLPPQEAVQDEVMYDVGTPLLDAKLVFEYPLPGVDYADRVYVFLGRVAEEAIRLNPDAASEYRWFSDQELDGENLAFDDKWMLEEVKKRRSS